MKKDAGKNPISNVTIRLSNLIFKQFSRIKRVYIFSRILKVNKGIFLSCAARSLEMLEGLRIVSLLRKPGTEQGNRIGLGKRNLSSNK